MNLLSKYGWAEAHQRYYTSLNKSLAPGRVISIRGFKYFIMTEKGELETELTGKLLFELENEDFPKVGDWVLFIDYETSGYIVDVILRNNLLTRKSPGRKHDRQGIAANIDYAVIVQGMDRDFNLMRLDRYIVQIIHSGILPVVLLNKADLVENIEHHLNEVSRLKRDCPVYVCSTYNKAGLDKFSREVLLPARTCVLIGSSGVGKSSILNTLLEMNIQNTAGVSDFNRKGKHTTTTRDLFLLPNGSIIIDTPGMREFGLTGDDDESEAEGFPVIKELARDCKFSNCEHMHENGCAVLAALSGGSLDPLIYNSYIKLLKEQRRFQIGAEEKKQQAKLFGKISREAKNHRKKYKF